MRPRKIKTQISRTSLKPNMQLSGWFAGKQTYLWFGEETHCFGTLEGQSLYRLAKAIVRQFEDSKK